MATTASRPELARRIPAQSVDGKRIDKRAADAFDQLKDRPSVLLLRAEDLRLLLPETQGLHPATRMRISQIKPSGGSGLLITAGLPGIVCIILAIVGLVTDYGMIFLPLAVLAGLIAYNGLARWVARQDHGSGVLRLAERIRRALAYEGDLKRQ